jgi:hypothetical protein
MNRELIHCTPALPRGDPPYQGKPCDAVRRDRLKRNEGEQGPHALLMTPCPFRGTRAAINTTVSLNIDVTKPAASANQCMFRGQKALFGGVTLLILVGDGPLRIKGW